MMVSCVFLWATGHVVVIRLTEHDSRLPEFRIAMPPEQAPDFATGLASISDVFLRQHTFRRADIHGLVANMTVFEEMQ